MPASETQVAVVGGGVVGCAVAHALARRGVPALLLEAQDDLALGASGANSGILHTGFDSTPGELETQLILRAAALREELLGELGIEVWRCGAQLTPAGEDEYAAVARLAQNARINGVEIELDADGSLLVPGESVTDPVAFVRALAGAARAGGTEVMLGVTVTAAAAVAGGIAVTLATGERRRARALVNCAGLYADELAHSTGDRLPDVYPRKGEFLVFTDAPPLEQILLPVPSALGKGVLVFPTLDRRAVIAGPTAREREDKRDWSVEPDAAELILTKVRRDHSTFDLLAPSAEYAGLRPAGRGANYVIERSRTLRGVIHVAAIRSTGLTASLAIGEHVATMLAADGAIAPEPLRALPTPERAPSSQTWWQRAAQRSGGSTATPGTPGTP
jgi:glycerol-3-phosphate dehydrogenase